jgi:hypothetical protein
MVRWLVGLGLGGRKGELGQDPRLSSGQSLFHSVKVKECARLSLTYTPTI